MRSGFTWTRISSALLLTLCVGIVCGVPGLVWADGDSEGSGFESCSETEPCRDAVNYYCDARQGICRLYCNDDVQCGEGEFCNLSTYHCEILGGDVDLDGEVDGEAPEWCLTALDCTPQQYCDLETHTCQARCGNDDDCKQGRYCMAGECKTVGPSDADVPWNQAEEEIEPDRGLETEDAENVESDVVERERESLVDCPSGQVCEDTTDGDDKKGSSKPSGEDSCSATDGMNTLVLMVSLLSSAWLLRRRFASKGKQS